MIKIKKRHDDSSGGEKPCSVCGEKIKKNARRCVHCSSWQDSTDDRRYWITTVLPLLVALFSVVITAVPIIEKAVVPKRSILSAVFQAQSSNYVSALVSNTGGRPGSIRHAQLIVPGAYGSWIIGLRIQTDDGSEALVVPSQESVLARLSPAQQNFYFPYAKGGNQSQEVSKVTSLALEMKDCKLIYLFSNFDGTPTSTEQSLKCYEVGQFRRAQLFETEFRDLYPTDEKAKEVLKDAEKILKEMDVDLKASRERLNTMRPN